MPRVHVVNYNLELALAKIVRFEFELPWVGTEPAVYQAIDGHCIGPTFLGHLVEHGRVMGFLLQRVEGRHGDFSDLDACQAIVERLHSLGIVHGDFNRHNFLVSPSDVTLIDFEAGEIDGSRDTMNTELTQLTEQLNEDGRGGGSMPVP